MPVVQLDSGRWWSSAVRHALWRSVQVAAGIVAVLAEMGLAAGVGMLEGSNLETTLLLLPTMLPLLPAAAFLSARAAAAWLRPRLQV